MARRQGARQKAEVAFVLVTLVWPVGPVLDAVPAATVLSTRPQLRIEGVEHLDVEVFHHQLIDSGAGV
jgi:hypothetical protein